MSEYQVVMFRAIDRALTDKQLEFMNRQSSRAEFTRWEFSVEYDYSSFHGDVDGMLRNGYDIFLTYSNYSCLAIKMRLPNGLPFSKSVWSKYIRTEGFRWNADKSGKAGILTLAPFLEEADDQLLEFDDYLDATAKLREMLIGGDLRVLYALWLCSAMASTDDPESLIEPPVPHGLGSLPKGVGELFGFFDTDPLLIAAAASGIPAFNAQSSQGDSVKAWLATITDARRNQIVHRLLAEDPVALKAELLSEMRDSQPTAEWPVQPPTRTVAQLMQSCELQRQKEAEKKKKQSAAKAKREADRVEKQRQERLSEMQSAPEAWLKKATALVKQRNTSNYREAASILADLRDAVGGDQGCKIARKHAAHLVKKFPTLHVLKSSLKKQQLLD